MGQGEAVNARSMQRCRVMWLLELSQPRAADKIKGLRNGTSRQGSRRVDYLLRWRWRGYGEEFPGTSSPRTARNFAGETPAELPDD